MKIYKDIHNIHIVSHFNININYFYNDVIVVLNSFAYNSYQLYLLMK